MPGLLLVFGAFFTVSRLGKTVGKALSYISRLKKILDEVELAQLRREQRLDLNSAKERWRDKVGAPNWPLLPFRHPLVQGDMLLFLDERVQLQEYLDVWTKNQSLPEGQQLRCGIDGPRLAHVGRERVKDIEMVKRALHDAEQNPDLLAA